MADGDLRQQLRETAAQHIANVSNLPGWMQPHALGRELKPVVDAVLDPLWPLIESALAAARAETAERIAVACEDRSPTFTARDTFLHGLREGYKRAAALARSVGGVPEEKP